MVLNIRVECVECDAIVGLVFHAKFLKWIAALLLHKVILLLNEMVHDSFKLLWVVLPLLLIFGDVVLLVLI